MLGVFSSGHGLLGCRAELNQRARFVLHIVAVNSCISTECKTSFINDILSELINMNECMNESIAHNAEHPAVVGLRCE